jgi:hypothetical protein
MTLLAAAAIVCSLSSARGATYTVKKLPSLKKNEAKDPSKDYGIERYKVSDTQVKDIYEIRVTYAAKCGMEKKPGLTINFIHNNVGEYESFCQYNTNYYVMEMKRDAEKQRWIEDGSFATSDGKSWFKTFLVIEPTVKVRTELKTVSMAEPLVKTYDLPFGITSYEERTPDVTQIVKSLYKKGEIDRFKIYDLKEERYTVRIKSGTCGMDREPCLQFDVAYNGHGSSDGKVYLTPKEMSKAQKAGKKTPYGLVVKQHTFKNREWGPGKPTYRVLVAPAKKKATLEITTKTAKKPIVRSYDLPF